MISIFSTEAIRKLTILFNQKPLYDINILIFSVNSPKATIENSNEDYTDYDNVVDRRTQSQIINGVNESADHPSGLDPNYSIHVLHNPYYDGEEQLNGPKSIVQINNLYYGGE